MKSFITENSKQTQKLGEMLAEEIKNGPASTRGDRSLTRGGKIICLSGELGSGKTTFTQGLLKGLKVKGPYTSPTFLVMKHYKKEISNSKSQIPNKYQNPKSKIKNIYHMDAYRVDAKDILNLGWEEIINNKSNVIIIEWADRISSIIPKGALWISFEWMDENKRKISFKSK